MQQRIISIQCFLVCALMTTIGVGGCPTGFVDGQILIGDDASKPTTAGTYWVEAADGELAYYELPEGDAAGSWQALAYADDVEWYAGPAWYEYSEDGAWSLDESLADVTLDDFLQTYDPAPAAD